MSPSQSEFAKGYYKRWKFNDIHVRSRVWARAPEITYQEVPLRQLYAILIGIGTYRIASLALSVIGDLFLFNSPCIGYCLWLPLSFIVGPGIAGLVAVKTGVEYWGIPLVLTAVVSFVEIALGVLSVANRLPILVEEQDSLPFTFGIAAVLGISLMVVAATLEESERYRLATVRSLSETASPNAMSPTPLSMGTKTASSSYQLEEHCLSSLFLLLATESIHAYFSLPGDPEIGTMALNDALTIIVLAASVMNTVNSVNASLVAGDYAWHWRAFRSTAIPAAILNAIVIVGTDIFYGTKGHAWRVFLAALRVCQIGAAGAIGAYSSLRIAQHHVYGQQELEEIYKRLVIPRPKRNYTAVRRNN